MTDVDTGLGQNHVTKNTFFNGFHSHLLTEDRQFLELIFFLTFNQGYQEFLLYFNVGSGTNISFYRCITSELFLVGLLGFLQRATLALLHGVFTIVLQDSRRPWSCSDYR